MRRMRSAGSTHQGDRRRALRRPLPPTSAALRRGSAGNPTATWRRGATAAVRRAVWPPDWSFDRVLDKDARMNHWQVDPTWETGPHVSEWSNDQLEWAARPSRTRSSPTYHGPCTEIVSFFRPKIYGPYRAHSSVMAQLRWARMVLNGASLLIAAWFLLVYSSEISPKKLLQIKEKSRNNVQ